jgi:hypothetical protein
VTCYAVGSEPESVCDRPTDKTGATNAEHSCSPASVLEDGMLELVSIGGHARFPNSGERGPLDPTAMFHPAGSAGYCVAHETLLEGAGTFLTSQIDLWW